MGETERRSEMFRDRERFTVIAGSPRISFHRAALNIQECLTAFSIRPRATTVIKPFKHDEFFRIMNPGKLSSRQPL